MARADYISTIEKHGGISFICITDLDNGRMSVTNNIEDVVDEIRKRYRILSFANYIIICCDSEGFWDRWDHETQTFFSIQELRKEAAINKCLVNFTKK